MLKQLKLCLVILLTTCLMACASVGQKFDTTHTNDIRQGQTKAEIQAWFGQPAHTSLLRGHPEGGAERWQWIYSHSLAGASTTTDSLVVDFDSKGAVCDHAYLRRVE